MRIKNMFKIISINSLASLLLLTLFFVSCDNISDKVVDSVVSEMEESTLQLKRPLLNFKNESSKAGDVIKITCSNEYFVSEEYVQLLISYLFYRSDNVDNLQELKILYFLDNSNDNLEFDYSQADIQAIKNKYSKLKGLNELIQVVLSECHTGYFQSINLSLKVVGEKYPDYAYPQTFSYLLLELLKDSETIKQGGDVTIAMFNYYHLINLTDLSEDPKYKGLAKYLRKIWKNIFDKSFDESMKAK